jgi:hypothetical protein
MHKLTPIEGMHHSAPEMGLRMYLLVMASGTVQVLDGRMPIEKKFGYRNRNVWATSCTQDSFATHPAALTGDDAVLQRILESMVCCIPMC